MGSVENTRGVSCVCRLVSSRQHYCDSDILVFSTTVSLNELLSEINNVILYRFC